MLMGPRDFHQKVVLPNLSDAKQGFGDERLAFNAIASVDALAAHIFYWCEANDDGDISGLSDDLAYRERLSLSNASFRLVRDLAKVQKHFKLKRGKPEITSAERITPRSLGWGEAAWGEGVFGGVSQLVVETDSGDFRVINRVLQEAIDFLHSEMDRLHIP